MPLSSTVGQIKNMSIIPPHTPSGGTLTMPPASRNSDGLIDFEEFRGMDKAFPLLFFPAFRLQDSLQKHFLGASANGRVTK